MNTSRHGGKEIVVARRERPQTRALSIRVTFEPSRLSADWVAQAYEHVVPITRRTTGYALPVPQAGRARPQQPGRRRSAS